MTTWHEMKICDNDELEPPCDTDGRLALMSNFQPGESVLLEIVSEDGEKTNVPCKIAGVQFFFKKVHYDLAFKIEGTSLYSISLGHRWGISRPVIDGKIAVEGSSVLN